MKTLLRAYAIMFSGIPLGYLMSYFGQVSSLRFFMPIGTYAASAHKILMPTVFGPILKNDAAVKGVLMTAILGIILGTFAMGLVAYLTQKSARDN